MAVPMIEVRGLGKQYRIGEFVRYRALRDSITEGVSRLLRPGSFKADRKTCNTFWAVRNISFDVQEGEVLGIIGHNGAGKSTLLKLLTRIMSPTEGTATLRGRVGSLLEVGTGFHPELTGRENVFLNGAILGLTKIEIAEKFDEIVEFSGVGKFLETPVKRYSSGMQMRLAFAVAAFLEPEIMLIDEVLSVGDTEFRKKSLKKMQGVANNGRTVIFVSHNMAAIRHLCDRVVLLEKGKVIQIGKADEVIDQYVNSGNQENLEALETRLDRKGNQKIIATGFGILNANQEKTLALISGEPGALFLDLKRNDFGANGPIRVSIILDTLFGQRVAFFSTEWTAQDIINVDQEKLRVFCRFDKLGLNTGHYSVTINVMVNNENSDWIMNAGSIFVEQGDFYGSGVAPGPQDGLILHHQHWSVDGVET